MIAPLPPQIGTKKTPQKNAGDHSPAIYVMRGINRDITLIEVGHCFQCS